MRKAFFSLFTLLLLATPAVMQAVTVNYSGDCANRPEGSTASWTMVITYDDNGNVTRREGINCLGDHWLDHCENILVVPGPLSTISEYVYASASGWWVRFNVDDNGRIENMWGLKANGTYWQTVP